MRKAFLVAALAACGGGEAPPPDDDVDVDAAARGNPPGTETRTLIVDGVERRVIVHVPELAADAAAPVVFMLHGSGQEGQHFYETSGWVAKAATDGMIVLFPDALRHCHFEDGVQRDIRKWASGNLGDPEGLPLCEGETLADDVAFFDAMLAMMREEYVIDDRAVYVTGFSNGGQMAARLVVERSEVIAAGHAAAGTIEVDVAASRPISMIFSVGTLDDRFTEPAGVAELPLGEEELMATPPIPGIVNQYRTALGLAEDYRYELAPIAGGNRAARFTFAGTENSFEAIFLEDLFHQYPNGDNYPLAAPEQLWAFFEGERLP